MTPPADAAVTILQTWSLVYGGDAPSSPWAYTVPLGSNANRLLVVAVAANRTASGAQTATVTYGGQTLTLQVGDGAATAPQQHSWLFYLNEAGIDAATSTDLGVSVTGGTLNYLHVYAAVYDGVCQSAPIADSRNYNSGTTDDTAVGPFAPALNIYSGNVAVEVVNITRDANNRPARTISAWYTNWTQLAGPNSDPSGPDRQSAYVATNSTVGTTTSEHTADGDAWDSMSAMSLAAETSPAFTSASSTTFTVGVVGTFTVTASGCPAPTLSMTGTLPSGVTFNPATGVLAGTPAAGTAGTYPLVFTAANGVSPNATQNFTLTVNQAPAFTSANATTFIEGVSGTFTVTATGSPAPTLSMTGTLPTGVTFTPATGILAGTPAAGTAGTFPLTFTAANGVLPNATQSFTLTVEFPTAGSTVRQQYVGNTASRGVWGDVTVGGSSSVAQTFTHVTAAATAQTPPGRTLLLVAVSLRSSGTGITVSSVSYPSAGTNLTALTPVTTGNHRVQLFYQINPTVSNPGTVTVTIANANAASRTVSAVAAARTFEGVATSVVPLGTAVSSVSAGGSSTPTTGAIALLPGRVAFGGGLAINNTFITAQNPDGQYIEWHAVAGSTAPALGWGAVRPTVSETSVTLGATINASSVWIMQGVPILPTADIVPILRASQRVAKPTDTVTYTASVLNRGDDSATNVQLATTVPAGMTVTSATGCAIAGAGPTTVTCPSSPIASLAARASQGWTINATAVTSGFKTATATVSTSPTTQEETANNSAAETVAVIGSSDGSGACTQSGKDGAGGTITGTVNTYYPGTASVAAGATSLALGTPTGRTAVGIGVGDRLLVIQMQGASLDSSNDSRYGDSVRGGFGSGTTSLGGVGLYEFVTAVSTLAPGASGTVTIVGNGQGWGLVNSYTNADATSSAGQSRFQVVRVPQYTTATLNNVQAQPWSTQTTGTIGLGTGGIVAIDASGQVTLGTTSIDVTGQGFRGGGQFQQAGASAPEDYRTTTGTLRYGIKGEGIAGTPKLVYVSDTNREEDTLPSLSDTGYPSGSAGRGAPANAGGGGTDTGPTNDNNSGGGGGANGGAGGWGGLSWLDYRPQGGGGGLPVPATPVRLFMGGGGGGGSNNNNPGNAGARGGGIVILTAGSLTGTGSILANGASAGNILNDGAGGGGAGGTVLVRAATGGLAGLTVNANGGNGGNAWPAQSGTTGFGGNRHGPGAGGGGGIVLFQATSAPTMTANGGNNGTTTDSADPFGARDGYPGTSSAFAGSLPGLCATCAADPAIAITHSPDPWTQGSTGRHVYVDLRNADYGTSTSGTTTVQITLPTTDVQLTPTAVSGGADWSCSIAGQVVTCTSTAAKAPLATFSQIDITVSVGSYTSSAVVTVPAVITGWGTNRVTTNDTASEDIIILSPTVAHVAEGYAVPMAEGVCLAWATSYEVSNLGFAVWRETATERVRVNDELVAGSALLVGADMPLAEGRPYRFLDTVARDLDAKYWVEDIDLSGRSTWHGPFLIDKDVPVGAGCPNAPTLRELGRLPEGVSLPAGMLASRAVAAPTLRPDIARQPSSTLGVQVGVKIGVQDTGWYRVPSSQLIAAGLDPAVDTANLQLYSEGVEYPFLVEMPTDVTTRRVDAIQFYGFGIDSPYTRTRVFWLVRGTRPGLRLTPAPRDEGSRPAAAFAAVAERRDRTTFFANLTTNGEAENFFGPLVATAPVVLPLQLEQVEPRSDIAPELMVRLQGVTDAVHRLDVSCNDRLLGTVQFAGRTAAELSLPVSIDLLKDGANTVTLVATGGALDYSLIDTIRLRYPHAYAATDGALELSLGAGEQARVTGFASTDLVLVDTTALDQLALVTPRFEKDGSGAALVVGADTARTFLAVTPARFRSPVSVVPNTPSGWSSRFNEADAVILTSSSMVGPAQSLQQYRHKTGLRVVIADIEDIYDEFSYGQKSPYAVRELVARSRGWRLPPSYLLLLGDATLDPKNYLGFGDFDFVPTKLVPTAFMKTASDDWLTDLRGDGTPALAVGRLPARSESEAALLVAKTLAFEQAGAGESWKSRLVLVSDIDQSGFAFTALSQDLEKLAGPTYQTQHISVGALGNTGARTALLASLNAGAFLVDFVGHGSQQTWRSTLFKNADALTLTNGGRLPIVTSMTCLNGYFQDVYGDSLAEALLRAPNGGAVATWASSTLTDPTSQADLIRAFFSVAFGPSTARLGDAARAAKGATSDADVRRSWILLGDPMLRLK